MSIFNDTSTVDCQSDSDSDPDSPSLPSLPGSLQQQLDNRGKSAYQVATTVKEVEEKLAELRRENFNLKLRLYFVEKDRNGITKPEYESVVAKEMAKRDKTIKALDKIVKDQGIQLESYEKLYEEEVAKKDLELERLRTENENLISDLQVNASVCRSLMSHLNEIRDYWKNQLLNTSSNGMATEMLASLSNWFNTSEDLLNSASVLIQEDCTQNISYRRESNLFDITQGKQYTNKNHYGCSNYVEKDENQGQLLCSSHHQLLPEPVPSTLPDDQNHREYLKTKEQLYQISSDSEDEWSEPDREAAKARMGITDIYAREILNNRSPPKSRRKRRSASGMSSLGLLPNVAEMMLNKTTAGKRSKPEMNSEGIQTELTILTLDAILYDYRQLVNKEICENSTQTLSIRTSDTCTQASRPILCHQSVGTEPKLATVNSFTQVLTTYAENGAQTVCKTSEPKIHVNNATQTDARPQRPQSFISSKNGSHVFVTDEEESMPFSSTKTNASRPDVVDSVDEFRKSNQTLYTYKAYLSPLKKSPPSSPTSVKSILDGETPLNGYRHADQLTQRCHYSSGQSLSCHKDFENNVSFMPSKSFPSSPIKRSPEIKDSLSNPDYRHIPSSQTFTTFVNNDKSNIKVKKATISKSSKVSLLNKEQEQNRGKDLDPNKRDHIGCVQCSSSSSSFEGKESPRSKTAKVRQSLTQEMAKISNVYNSSHNLHPPSHHQDEGLALSSPDLGLGDSDQDLNGSLRAYLSLSNYQLLRRNINEALSVITTMENLSRDFSMKIIKVVDYYNEMSSCISHIVQVINSSTSICRTFRVEDINSLMMELEKMRSKKENMEKAITRQLIKTDKLLKKAKVNLKDS